MAAAPVSATTRTSSSSNTNREGSAKSLVAEQISQTVQSTSNLLHLMLQSSPSQAHLIKIPRNLVAKTATIKNSEQVLEQLPRVVSSLDAYMDNALQSVPHLETVIKLLENMENSQLKPLYAASLSSQKPKPTDSAANAGHETQ